MLMITRETWNVTVDGRRVATIDLPGSDADWAMVSRYRDMLGGNAELSLAAYDNGTLDALLYCGIQACDNVQRERFTLPA
jgi:hypothetical protein